MNDQKHGNGERDRQKPSVEKPVDSAREGDGNQPKKPSKPLLQQIRELGIDRKIELGIALAGLVIAGILVYAAVNQLSVMRDQTASMQGQLNEMRSGGADTKAIAEATRIAADAAAASVGAWIIADSWMYKGIEKDRIVFQIDFKNIGKTVALEVGFTATFKFFEGKQVNSIPVYQPFQCPEVRGRPGITPPDGRALNTIYSEPYSVDQLKMLTEKRGYIFIHGCAIYRDILSNKEHITEIASIYTGADKPGHFTLYAPYNRMK